MGRRKADISLDKILRCEPQEPPSQTASTFLTWNQALFFCASLAQEGKKKPPPPPFFFCSKAFPRIYFAILFSVSNHQIVDEKN